MTNHRMRDERIVELGVYISNSHGKLGELLAALKDERTENETLRADRCETCGATLYSGPPDCHICGAPQCCQQCCEIDTLRARVKELEESYRKLERNTDGVVMRRAIRAEKKCDALKAENETLQEQK